MASWFYEKDGALPRPEEPSEKVAGSNPGSANIFFLCWRSAWKSSFLVLFISWRAADVNYPILLHRLNHCRIKNIFSYIYSYTNSKMIKLWSFQKNHSIQNKITVIFIFHIINGIGSWGWISPDQKHDAAVLMVGPQHSLVTNYATPTVNRNLIRSSDWRQLFCISVLLSSLPPSYLYNCIQNTNTQLFAITLSALPSSYFDLSLCWVGNS